MYFRLSNYGVPWFSRTGMNHHWIWLLFVCQVPSFWLCSIFLAAAVSLTCSGDAGAALGEGGSWKSQNFLAMLLEMGRRLDRIQNFLGCHQSCVDFMAVKLSQHSPTRQLEQLWANILTTAGKFSKTLNRENPMLKNLSKTLHMHPATP